MGIQIGARPDSGFDDPIGMLTDCHRRIERFIRVLCLVAERARGRRLTDEESAAVTSSLSYFRTGGLRHTADEEQSLFPRLREVGAVAAMQELQRLENDHQSANKMHAAVERLFLTWLESGTLSSNDESILQKSTTELERIYAEHIKVEEEVVFQQAAFILNKQALEAMGEEFRSRRS